MKPDDQDKSVSSYLSLERDVIKATGLKRSEISERMGYTTGYISQQISRNYVPKKTIDRLRQTFKQELVAGSVVISDYQKHIAEGSLRQEALLLTLFDMLIEVVSHQRQQGQVKVRMEMQSVLEGRAKSLMNEFQRGEEV